MVGTTVNLDRTRVQNVIRMKARGIKLAQLNQFTVNDTCCQRNAIGKWLTVCQRQVHKAPFDVDIEVLEQWRADEREAHVAWLQHTSRCDWCLQYSAQKKLESEE